ncbi:saccharopine dehydrogenase NADP-binding domain-containing protein [Natronoglycomyces albus]|uniref:Saccharopine dehydrogenase NADP-binding domain-containing protein n=1 Tax=Natronoglycomyces albus TaxID=2811108 RepID=A0A895XWC7_9ACTN|nr:saccharopine dehydrogenase NADP-binding domain-containing protein [Natronoglycomyces albus]QSB06826.1 saccharopine dehydrogenase NADP-binding domain-containing protein [Natronoglycomyces albus]
MTTTQPIAIYGATGHTAQFITRELHHRGYPTIISGRDTTTLTALAHTWKHTQARPASIEDPSALDRALDGSQAVINCAGPFALTATPLIEAAQRAHIPYLDIAAEIEANLDTFTNYATASIPIVPAMAFFGGLADLLATAAISPGQHAEAIHIAYGLTSWHPTPGTRSAGRISAQRRAGKRIRFADKTLQYHDEPARQQEWTFPAPLGQQTVWTEFTMADVVTIPSHLNVTDIHTYMTHTAVEDISNPDTPAPQPTDTQGRSDQRFTIDLTVDTQTHQQRATAHGRDIYATTAPLVVEALQRILARKTHTTGAASPGHMFDAADFLRTLAPHLDVTIEQRPNR